MADINIYGKLVSGMADKILADASQIDHNGTKISEIIDTIGTLPENLPENVNTVVDYIDNKIGELPEDVESVIDYLGELPTNLEGISTVVGYISSVKTALDNIDPEITPNDIFMDEDNTINLTTAISDINDSISTINGNINTINKSIENMSTNINHPIVFASGNDIYDFINEKVGVTFSLSENQMVLCTSNTDDTGHNRYGTTFKSGNVYYYKNGTINAIENHSTITRRETTEASVSTLKIDGWPWTETSKEIYKYDTENDTSVYTIPVGKISAKISGDFNAIKTVTKTVNSEEVTDLDVTLKYGNTLLDITITDGVDDSGNPIKTVKNNEIVEIDCASPKQNTIALNVSKKDQTTTETFVVSNGSQSKFITFYQPDLAGSLDIETIDGKTVYKPNNDTEKRASVSKIWLKNLPAKYINGTVNGVTKDYPYVFFLFKNKLPNGASRTFKSGNENTNNDVLQGITILDPVSVLINNCTVTYDDCYRIGPLSSGETSLYVNE